MFLETLPARAFDTKRSATQVADLGASRRFDQDEAARRLADHEGGNMLSMTLVGTPVSQLRPI